MATGEISAIHEESSAFGQNIHQPESAIELSTLPTNLNLADKTAPK
jgi:hypothetical protein